MPESNTARNPVRVQLKTNTHQNKMIGQIGEGKKQGQSQICTLKKGAPEMTHSKAATEHSTHISACINQEQNY